MIAAIKRAEECNQLRGLQRVKRRSMVIDVGTEINIVADDLR